MINYIIITGTSRGLGEAISTNLLQPNNHLFCVSRSLNNSLINNAETEKISLDYLCYDLNKVNEIDKLFEKIFSKINFDKANSITLINNAGVLKPITVAGKYECEDVLKNIHVNLLAPIISTNAFIKYINDLDVKKCVINISSGVAVNAYYGWGPYCASKSGLNIFSKCVSLEQKLQIYPVDIFAVAPGIIDTKMQADIRKANKDDFIDLERFVSYKKDDKLMSADFVAKKIVQLLDNNKFESGDFINIDDI